MNFVVEHCNLLQTIALERYCFYLDSSELKMVDVNKCLKSCAISRLERAYFRVCSLSTSIDVPLQSLTGERIYAYWFLPQISFEFGQVREFRTNSNNISSFTRARVD